MINFQNCGMELKVLTGKRDLGRNCHLQIRIHYHVTLGHAKSALTILHLISSKLIKIPSLKLYWSLQSYICFLIFDKMSNARLQHCVNWHHMSILKNNGNASSESIDPSMQVEVHTWQLKKHKSTTGFCCRLFM